MKTFKSKKLAKYWSKHPEQRRFFIVFVFVVTAPIFAAIFTFDAIAEGAKQMSFIFRENIKQCSRDFKETWR